MPEIAFIRVGFEPKAKRPVVFTPWGKADHVEKLGEGVIQVGTPSHGGFGVDQEVAAERLSPAARAQAIKQGGRYFFEEDCDWAIVAREMPELFSDRDREFAAESLRRWNEKYLQAVGQ